MKNLFEQIISSEKCNQQFLNLMGSPIHFWAKQLINEVYFDMKNKDQNFVQEFQGENFNSRVFELCMYPALKQLGFEVECNKSGPDFLITKNGKTAFVEATTCLPQSGKKSLNTLKHLRFASDTSLASKAQEEFPIKLGSSLRSKVQKKYWELPMCKGFPLIIAVQAMYEAGSLMITDLSACEYLYGIRLKLVKGMDENAYWLYDTNETHTWDKTIPSNFFSQPFHENISAVLFSNSFTVPKFLRMSYQAGYGQNHFPCFKSGECRLFDGKYKIETYQYQLGQSAQLESWDQGLTLIKNPNALNPLPEEFFENTTKFDFRNNDFEESLTGFHPMTSFTSDKIR